MSQTYFPGTEPPNQDPDIEAALDAWLEAKHQQKNASEATNIAHAALVVRVTESGREHYAYVDRTSGKKRIVYPDRSPRMKTKAAARSRQEETTGEEVERPSTDRLAETVEMRRVPRASVEKEIDPFAATRAAMDDHLLPGEKVDLKKPPGRKRGK